MLLQEQHGSTIARFEEQDESTHPSCSPPPSPSLSTPAPAPDIPSATASALSPAIPQMFASVHPSSTPHVPALAPAFYVDTAADAAAAASGDAGAPCGGGDTTGSATTQPQPQVLAPRSPSDDVPVLTSRLQLTEKQMTIGGCMVGGVQHAQSVSSATGALLAPHDAAAAGSDQGASALQLGGGASQQDAARQRGSEVGASAAGCRRCWKRAAAAACILVLLALLRRCGVFRLRMRGLLGALKCRLKQLY